jgi:hypothetical protein
MSTKVKLLACLAGAAIPCLLAVAAHSDETYTVKTIIPVPGGLNSFDISFVDANIHTFVLADRTNKSIDVVNTHSNTLTAQLTATPPFAGLCVVPAVSSADVKPDANICANASGPNGVIIVDQREVWATDAPPISNIQCTETTRIAIATAPPPHFQQVCTATIGTSSVKVINLKTGHTIATIDMGGKKRTDELCEDVGHEVVLIANDDPGPADNFLAFISTESHHILQKIKLDGSDQTHGKITLTGVTVPTKATVAANGIEQCKFNPRTGSYYLAVPATKIIPTSGLSTDGPGVVLKISKNAPFHIEQTFTIDASTGCTGPQGLAIGPRHEIQLGCGGTNSLIIDDRTGATIALQAGEGGADEVWYNPGDNSYFIARSTAGKLGVQDARSSPPQADVDVATAVGSHSVAADMLKNQIYIPANKAATALCGSSNGCIAVFTAPNDDRCLAEGMPVLDHDDGDDPVFMRTRCHRERDDDDHNRDRDRDREARR